MTIRLFKKMAAILIHRLYPPPQTPAGPGQNVQGQAGEVLLDSGIEGGLCGIGKSTGACFKVALGPKVHWIKIGASGRPHLLKE